MLKSLRKQNYKKKILNIFSKIPLYEFLYRQNQNKGIILVYHQIKDSISFEKQIAFISSQYQVLPLETLVTLIANRKSLPSHSLSITFDDGYRNLFENAYPVLVKYKCPATIFLNTGFIDNDKPIWPFWVREYILRSKKPKLYFQYKDIDLALDISSDRAKSKAFYKLLALFKHELQADLWLNLDKLWKATGNPIVYWDQDELLLTWNQIHDMEMSRWIQCGNHTVSHRITPWIDDSSLKTEIDCADTDLKKHLSFPSPTFAFPNGEYDERTVMYLAEKGYIGAVTTQEKLITSLSDPMKAGRIGANCDEDLSLLKFRLCGALPMIKRFIT